MEKINIWESKIKTMKGLREMASPDLTFLRQKIGHTLYQQLLFLTNLVLEKSDSLNVRGEHLITLLKSYESN
jgi:hypothetical protein